MRKQRHLRKIAYFLPIVALACLAAICQFCLKGYSFLTLVLICVALLIFAYYLLSLKDNKFTRYAKTALSMLTCIGVIMAIIAEIPIIITAQKKEKADSDYCVVLGAAVHGSIPSRVLSERINAAYEFLTEYPETKAILSGGKGKNENLSEAECMYEHLIARGIAPERLIKETESTSTRENIEFSYKLMNTKSFTLISSETHLYRSCLIAKKAGLSPSPYGATTETPVIIPQYLRECVAVWAEWIF